MINYLGEYVTLGSMFDYPGEYVQLPWGVFSTTLGSILNYLGESFKENISTKVRKIVQRFQGDVIFQKSDPPEAAPLLAPCLKITKQVRKTIKSAEGDVTDVLPSLVAPSLGFGKEWSPVDSLGTHL